MAEAFKTDAIRVGDDQMVMKDDSHDRQGRVTHTLPVSRYIWVFDRGWLA